MKLHLIVTFLLTILQFTTHAQIQLGADIDGEAAFDNLGSSVSISSDGSRVAIGATDNDGNGAYAGHVRIYEWIGSGWTQLGADIEGEAANDESGWCVSISADGNRVAIGAEQNDGNGGNSGHVRIYEWTGSSWTQLGADIDGEAAGDRSGYSVSISSDGNRVAIGAIYNTGNGFHAGHVRIYEWIGSSWIQLGADFDAEGENDNLGMSVSLSYDGSRVAIGAPYNIGNSGLTGHVRIFERVGDSWVQLGADIDGEEIDDWSGYSVSISSDGSRVAIGAKNNDGNGNMAGHVRVYEWSGSSWMQLGADIDGEAMNDESGNSVSISSNGNRVAIGAKGNDGNGTSSGHVRIYEWIGGNWIQLGIDIDGEAAGDRSGYSVSISSDGNHVAIGAIGNYGFTGHARIYSFKGVYGKIFHDFNENCLADMSETGLEGRGAIITPGNYTVETTNDGVWHIDSLPTGTYTITVDTSGHWSPTCLINQSFIITNPEGSSLAPSFGFISTQPCSEPNVSVNMPFMRPGFSNQHIFVNACNDAIATGALLGAYVDLEIDSLLTIQSASIPYTNQGNNSYRFLLGNMNPGQCKNFSVACSLSVNAVLGQTLCMQANLFPADNCVFDTLPANPPTDFTPCDLPWDNSSISVDGWCQNDSIYFVITNTGDLGDGDMDCYSPVRLYIDGEYISLDSIQLLGGQTDTLIFAGDGRTFRLEVDQHPLHPGNSHPNATIELCGNPSNWTSDLVNILPMDDADPIKDIYCGLVTGSYDPNDKKGYPLGVTEDHFITPNGQIEYMIRFQNTGTDTAFTVVVTDTLDTDLDIFSVRSGASSHDYSFQIFGQRILEWTFNNIMLPDSNVNEPESNGFITFTIDQNNDLIDGTEINNSANIYFDFNAPIITNTSSHVINRNIGNPSWAANKTIVATDCDEYLYNGYSYTNTGTYWQVEDDTLVTLDVTILNSTSSSDIQTACDSYTWIDENTYTSSNNSATYVLTNAAGCDSIVTLDLTITNSTSSTDVKTACDSYTWIDGNTYTSINNTATHILTNSEGCDSLVTLDLTITNSTSSTVVQIACDNYTWIDGNTYTSTNNSATHILTNATGCDSVITLDLTITNSTSSNDVQTACDSYTWMDGNIYTSSNNSATYVLTNAAGCDSLVTLDLTITNSTSSTDVQTACDSYTWIDGNTYTSTNNSATHNLTTIAGCDSLVTLDLTITNSTSSTDVQTACDSYTWMDGNTYTSSNNSATFNIAGGAANGCDSLITLDLTINTVSDLSISTSGETITANNTDATYQWLNCDDNFAIIASETGESFTATVNGNYAVEITENGCVDTTDCVAITSAGIIENNFGDDLVVSPNPTDGNFSIDLGVSYENAQITITDLSGKLIASKNFTDSQVLNLYLDEAAGVYLVSIQAGNKKAVIQLVKE